MTFYWQQNIISVMKSGKIRRAGVGEKGDACGVLVGKPEGWRQLGSCMLKWILEKQDGG
jgi:hypothetical protein